MQILRRILESLTSLITNIKGAENKKHLLAECGM